MTPDGMYAEHIAMNMQKGKKKVFGYHGKCQSVHVLHMG
jgi:hypothetical protein